MKPSLRKLIALLLLAGLSTTTVLAARGQHQRTPNPELRREVRAYVTTNVLPVLRQQRKKLETELAPADQTQLTIYRAQLKDLGHRAQALRQSERATHAAMPAPDSAARVLTHRPQSPEQQALRTERREIMQHVAQLAQKYEANITRLAGEIQPQQTQWTTDIKAIVVKNSTAEQQERMARFQGMAASRFSGLRKLLKASRFLLMDPGATGSLPDVAAGTSLYPNPVAATSQLQYEVKEAGPVTVELLDKAGNPLRTVVAARREQGTYQEALTLSDLPSGTYYYKVTTQAGTETKRFVKE